MNIGDIHWVELPSSSGSEQHGRRPAIIVQDESYAGRLPTVLVVPLSTTRRALRFAGTTLIKATADSKLRADSVALVFQVRVIDRNRIKNRIGTISAPDQDAVFKELDKLTGR